MWDREGVGAHSGEDKSGWRLGTEVLGSGGCEWSLLSEEAGEPAGSKGRSPSDVSHFTQTLAGLLQGFPCSGERLIVETHRRRALSSTTHPSVLPKRKTVVEIEKWCSVEGLKTF